MEAEKFLKCCWNVRIIKVQLKFGKKQPQLLNLASEKLKTLWNGAAVSSNLPPGGSDLLY